MAKVTMLTMAKISAIETVLALPSPVSGAIIEILAEDGGVIAAGTLMAIIEPD